MNMDWKQATTNLLSIMVLGGAFYALVIYEFQLDDLVVGAIISWVTLVLNSHFADAAASRQSRQQQAAYDSGVKTPTPEVTFTSEVPR